MSKTKAIIKKEGLHLMEWQMKKLYTPTPEENVYQRKVRGGKVADYVRISYVINQLNNIFSPIGWDFEVTEHGESDKDVWVKGKITIKDHKGHTVTKTQFGQSLKQVGVPKGDTLKAATSDCLKKCASMLGIALDIYSKILDQDGRKEVEKVENRTGNLMASESDKERIRKVGKELGCKTVRDIEKKTGLKIDWDNTTKVQASKILFILVEKKAKK